MNKKNIPLYLCIAIFGILGIYLTFISGNTDKYNSQTKAYRIDPNESYDIDDGTTYQPIYYFKVKGKEYECRAKTGSSTYPNEKNNAVYYDSSNPTNCKTEYEKSTNKVAGIICLIVTAIIIYFFIIKKPSDNSNNLNQIQEVNPEKQHQLEQQTEKIIEVVEKIQLIYKRVIIGIIIVILLVLILIDTAIFKQTIISKDYPEVTAVYVNKKDDEESNVFDDYIYTFTDKQGKQQEIIVSIPIDDNPQEEIKIKYNENNPQDYYEESSTMDKTGIIWYIVKVVAMILLIILFFNKRLLSKINILAS